MIVPIKLKISWAYLLKGDSGNVLIDTGSPGEELKIVRALQREGLEVKDLSLILHTHGHIDHVGSTAALLKMHPVPTAIHPGDAEMAENGRNRPVKYSRFISRMVAAFVMRKTWPPFKADLFLDKPQALREFGVNADLLMTPGHTAGSISILTPDRELVMGDTFMGGYLGGVISPGKARFHYFYEEYPALLHAIRMSLETGAERFFPGHGGPILRASALNTFGRELGIGS